MTRSLLGNPHSASLSSQLSSRHIDDTRLRVLRFLNASPDHFDVVFVANATAAIKLVADAFRDNDTGFWYGYHTDSHTSLVGVRELAEHGSHAFKSDGEVEAWISQLGSSSSPGKSALNLFAYPGQSNMTGYRPPLDWCAKIRRAGSCLPRKVYTLYDAAGLLSTSCLDLSDASTAPDFISLSFHKIFGFPDLGALIVQKDAGDVLGKRKFFGGGTVDMVISLHAQWHAKKDSSLHSRLEDGTLPFHSILALSSALAVHSRIYGSLRIVSRHTSFLAAKVYQALDRLRHSNGAAVCMVYKSEFSSYGDPSSQGATIAFNLRNSNGEWVGKSEVEKLASVKNIQMRTGGLCNPGGISHNLGLSAEELRRNFAAGQRCGDDHDLLDGKPTGVVRISFGAMSSLVDVEKFLAFIEEFYVDKTAVSPSPNLPRDSPTRSSLGRYFIETLTVFPIKSCAAFIVPPETLWEVREEGLAWDREWCLVHQGTGVALSQKRYPGMALLRPFIDVEKRLLGVSHNLVGTSMQSIEIALDRQRSDYGQTGLCDGLRSTTSKVCGDKINIQVYDSPRTQLFFTEALGVPCTLGRCPPKSANRVAQPRRPKPGITSRTIQSTSADLRRPEISNALLLSNESPILVVSKSSVNRLNEGIKAGGTIGQAVPADSFRANIVIAQDLPPGKRESPYFEDRWKSLQVGEDESNRLVVLGPCQRCPMVCVDQQTGKKRQEPYATLAKTRRRDGGVWFGIHVCLARDGDKESAMARSRFVKVGDTVTPCLDRESALQRLQRGCLSKASCAE